MDKDNCNHDCNDDCNCHGNDDVYETINITLDDGSELICSVLGVFDVDENSYIALMPVGDEEVLIYSYIESENSDDIELELIESDEEFEKVSAAFDDIFRFDEFESFEFDFEDEDFDDEEYEFYEDDEEEDYDDEDED